MDKISCVICAYNEEKRIGNVLAALKNHPLLGEIIVVDDGSADRTSDVAASYNNIILIKHGVNKGKSKALATGISASKFEIIMMLDADLIGLSANAVKQLAEPVLSGNADITMSLRKNSLFIFHWLGIDYVSGERVFKKDLLFSSSFRIVNSRWLKFNGCMG